MSNEELVNMIQNGQRDLIESLWWQVYKFVRKMAKQRLAFMAPHFRDLEDDLVSEAYFGMIEAIKKYDETAGKSFLSYLGYYLHRSFNHALGYLTTREQGNSLLETSSLRLDAPPCDDIDDITLLEIIADPNAELSMAMLEDKEFWMDVHQFLRRTIKTVAHDKVRRILLVMLKTNCGYTNACQLIGMDTTEAKKMRRQYDKTLRKIERHMKGRARKECKEIGIFDYYSLGIQRVGYGAYVERSFTSTTERVALEVVHDDFRKRNVDSFIAH